MQALLPVLQDPPVKRGDCLAGGSNTQRPCPWVSCKYHLAVEIGVEEETESCTLDIAERGGLTLEEVGDIMGLTRERIRQIEQRAEWKLLRLATLRPDLFETNLDSREIKRLLTRRRFHV